MGLIAGAAQREITPASPAVYSADKDHPLALGGYADPANADSSQVNPHPALSQVWERVNAGDRPIPSRRIATGVHDPLLACALYLDDGHTRLIFVAVDVLMLSSETVRRCRQDIQAATGVPAGHILISASHTHSAPLTVDLLALSAPGQASTHSGRSSLVDPEYLESLCQQIQAAAVSAWQAAVPARTAFTRVRADGVGGNRHHPGGPHDPEASLLVVETIDSARPLALSLVYGLHPTVLHAESTLVSADFPGYTRAYLTERLPGVVVLYHNAPCGNLSPRYFVKAHTFEEAERLGNRLGEAVFQALGTLEPADFSDQLSLAGGQAWAELPRRVFPPRAEAAARLAEAAARLERLIAEHAPPGQVRTAEVDLLGAKAGVNLAEAQADGAVAALQARYTPCEVQALRVGSTCFIGLPGELFVEYGLELKRRAPCEAVVISLANGELQGYIVTPDAQGYEAAVGLFTPQAGQALVETALGLISREDLHPPSKTA